MLRAKKRLPPTQNQLAGTAGSSTPPPVAALGANLLRRRGTLENHRKNGTLPKKRRTKRRKAPALPTDPRLADADAEVVKKRASY